MAMQPEWGMNYIGKISEDRIAFDPERAFSPLPGACRACCFLASSGGAGPVPHRTMLTPSECEHAIAANPQWAMLSLRHNGVKPSVLCALR